MTAFRRLLRDLLLVLIVGPLPGRTESVYTAATSEEFGRGMGSGFWRMYDVRDGLSGDDVLCLHQDRAGYLWFGTDNGVSRFDGQEFVSFSTADGLAANRVVSIAEDGAGHLWFGTDGGVSHFDGVRFTSYTERDRYLGWGRKDRLAGNDIHFIFQDRDERLWFGTDTGVSRFDGEEFLTLTTEFGLADNRVLSIRQDAKGHVWLGTGDGISRYDGQLFRNYAAESELSGSNVNFILEERSGKLWFGAQGRVSRFDGEEFTAFPLGEGEVLSALEDRKGVLWFGTADGVIYRYEGDTWETFAAGDGEAGQEVVAIFEDRAGDLWFGSRGSGVCRYDGREWMVYPTGSLRRSAQQIIEDGDGSLWFGTDDGVYRYDGYAWTTYTTADGLADDDVRAIGADQEGDLWCETAKGICRFDGDRWRIPAADDGLMGARPVSGDRSGHRWQGMVPEGLAPEGILAGAEDPKGHVWLATTAGLVRHDGEEWRAFTTRDGLAHNRVGSVFVDRSGHMWFGTRRSGVSRYDGRVFQTLTPADGLAGSGVRAVYQDEQGQYWFATDRGISRYRPPEASPPSIILDAVVADRRYGPNERASLSSDLGVVAFEFHAISFKTRPEAVVFRYRLRGLEDEWRTTRTRSVRYEDLPQGEYAFEVLAVDRDLAYSDQPAVVELRIHQPRERNQWMAALGVALALCAWQTARVFKSGRRQRQGAEDALCAARDMQMALMPEERCELEGFEIMGRCLPARESGGNLFAFFRRGARLVIALAEVDGRGVRAAAALRTLHGVLENEMQHDDPIAEAVAHLDRTLGSVPDGRTRLILGELDPASCTLCLVNAGCPPPCLFHAETGEMPEVEQRADPLGAGSQGTRPLVSLHLGPGDRVVFCSHGVVESRSPEGEALGASRLSMAFGEGCREEHSVRSVLRSLFGEIAGFSRGMPREGDQTIIMVGRHT